MLCNSCNSKSVCKHYDLVINSHDVIMNITECKYYSHKASVEETVVKTLAKEHRKDLNTSFDLRSTGVNESLFKTSCLDVNNNISVTPVKVSKVTCSKCGKQIESTKAQNCQDCGELVCYDCGYTTVDVNTNEPILTCDNCFNGTKSDNDVSLETIDWDISSFEKDWNTSSFEKEEEKETEVKADVKSGKTKTKRVNKKSKDT